MKSIVISTYFIILTQLVIGQAITYSSKISASVSPTNSGTITGTGNYNRGSTATLVATAKTGYTFSKWTERSKTVSTSATYSFIVTNSRTLVANFTQIKKYIISTSVSPVKSGTVTGAGIYFQGSTATLIAVANSNYTFINWIEGKTIVSTSSSLSFVVNASRNLVANFVINNPPSASNLSITGTLYTCKTLTGHYSYSDLNGDPEHGSTFRWYRASTLSLSDTVFIYGATSLTYTLTDADSGKYIYFRVTPKALTGTTTGTPVLSGFTAIISKSIPRVTLTTTQNTICEGQSTVITMSFIGTPPYHFVYTDGFTENTIKATTDIFSLTVSNEGTYKGKTLTDYYSCPISNISSTVDITINPLPSVKITGLNETYYLTDGPVTLNGNPIGGTFAGDGVVPSANLFYPSIAGVDGSPHSIVYSFTSPTTGCKNADIVNVNITGTDAFITLSRSGGKYCNYDTAFLIIGRNLSGSVGTFKISGGTGLTDNANNTATINPSLLPAGSYTISYTYFNKVSSTITKSIVIENFASPIMLGVNQSNYCSNSTKIQLSVNNYTEGVFSGNGVVKYSNNAYYFDPSIAIPGRAPIYFVYTTSYGCNVVDSVITKVSQSPIAMFSVQNNCWKSDSTVFINLTKPVNSVNNWKWHFGDNSASGDKNTSDKFEQKHLYPSYGDYSVMLIARNNNNCSDTIQKNVHLNDIPVVNFNWKSECFVPDFPISFNNLTTHIDAVATYKWVVQNSSNAIFQFNTKNLRHIYPNVNNYPVKLVVTTVNGCKDSVIKTIPLRPVFSLKDSVYFNSFEISKGYWYPGNSVNNWTWGTPDGNVINSAYSGNKALYTSFNLFRKNEQLVITSPCYDFTGVTKPFIQMWVNSNSDTGQEGAVLQYAVDTVLQWNNVKSKGSGINWYNDNSISTSPGGQTVGWSGTTGWVHARNNLDALNGLKYVRFRLIYGSNSASLIKDGFAFDEVYIGKRSNKVLFEHFTDMTSAEISQTNIDVDNLLQTASEDALGIQYHKSFNNADTLTNNHSATRILYYGFGSMPHCYLDGGTNPKYVYNFSTQLPSLNDVYTRVLKDADYSITINKDKSMQQLSGTVFIKALKDIAKREVGVYIAVVEDIIVQSDTSVITFNNVLKTILPTNVSSFGYYINKSLAKDEEVTIPYTWQPQGVYNTQKLKLVVFIQDFNTKEVYQATGSEAKLIVGIKDINDTQIDVFDAVVYPNPVKDLATVVFGKKISLGFEMMLIDQKGKVLKQVKLLSGASAVVLEIANLLDGIYFIRIYNTKTREIKNLKLIVNKRL